MKTLSKILVVGLLLFVGSLSAIAQTTSGGGTLQGSVKDETGAAIPNATVKITSLTTGAVSTFVTTSAGLFVTPTINIGKYKVRIEASGMKAWEGQVQIETAREISIEPVMKVGEVTETVVIEGNIAPLSSTPPNQQSEALWIQHGSRNCRSTDAISTPCSKTLCRDWKPLLT